MKSLLFICLICVPALCLACKPEDSMTRDESDLADCVRTFMNPCFGVDIAVSERWLEWLRSLRYSRGVCQNSYESGCPELPTLIESVRFKIELCKAFERDFPPPPPPPRPAPFITPTPPFDPAAPLPASSTGPSYEYNPFATTSTGSGYETASKAPGTYSYESSSTGIRVADLIHDLLGTESSQHTSEETRGYRLDSNQRFNDSETAYAEILE